ncbi:MAG: hypothetical protein L0Z62_00375 [Gemmataceae bacterium]|nr:hypothetical protein [Gemmataceae bacterium]
MPSIPDPTPPLPSASRGMRRSMGKGCILGALAGGLGGPALVGIGSGAAFILKRAGRRLGWLGLVLEPIVFLACAVVVALDLLLFGLFPSEAWSPHVLMQLVLLRTLVGLFAGAMLGAFVGWAVATARE